jgi:hypothetical protein
MRNVSSWPFAAPQCAGLRMNHHTQKKIRCCCTTYECVCTYLCTYLYVYFFLLHYFKNLTFDIPLFEVSEKHMVLVLWVTPSAFMVNRSLYICGCLFCFNRSTTVNGSYYFSSWVHWAIGPYSLYNLHISFLECAILHASQIKVRICLGYLELSYVYRCQQTCRLQQKSASVWFCPSFPSCTLQS